MIAGGIIAESIIYYFYMATVLQIFSNWTCRSLKTVLAILTVQELSKIPCWISANAHSTALKHRIIL